MGDVVGLAALGWTFATSSVGLFAWLRSARQEAFVPPLKIDATLLRPCAGDEPGLEAALASSSEAGELGARIRFLVASEEDPALPTARRVAHDLTTRGFDASVMVTGARGPNRKADQLARGLLADTRTDLVMVADSDVVLDRDVLAALVADGADARWAPPLEVRPRTYADRTSACVLDGTLHAFGLLSALDPAGMVGKTFVVRRDALEAAGGFEGLTDRLGEDMELARRLRANARTISVVHAPCRSLASGRSWSNVVDRYARWITVIRAQRPLLLASYPLLFGAAPLQLALAAASDHALAAASIVLGARLFGALLARARSGHPLDPSLPCFALVADMLLLVAFVVGIARRRFVWRGTMLSIGAEGALVAAAEVER